MTKLTFNEVYALAEKDIEKKLWKVFWSYAQELGLNEDDAKKEEMVQRATDLIPEFSASVKELELTFEYPVVHMFLTSLHLGKNFLDTAEVHEIMAVKGPDNDAKLAFFVARLQQGGLVWQG